MKKTILIFFVIGLVLLLIKRKDMTWRQSIYPFIMLKGKWFPANNDIQVNTTNKKSINSFYLLKAIANNGDTIKFSKYKGKKILIINTASDCGFTAQYDELEKLHSQYKDRLIMIAFPANDFKEQEKNDDAAIAAFCKLNYGISFQLMKKCQVVKGLQQNPVFQWLSNANQNGWCDQEPLWNFNKYLINEEGELTHFYSQLISPMSNAVRDGLVE